MKTKKKHLEALHTKFLRPYLLTLGAPPFYLLRIPALLKLSEFCATLKPLTLLLFILPHANADIWQALEIGAGRSRCNVEEGQGSEQEWQSRRSATQSLAQGGSTVSCEFLLH